jgi:hypothetical protein
MICSQRNAGVCIFYLKSFSQISINEKILKYSVVLALREGNMKQRCNFVHGLVVSVLHFNTALNIP